MASRVLVRRGIDRMLCHLPYETFASWHHVDEVTKYYNQLTRSEQTEYHRINHWRNRQ